MQSSVVADEETPLVPRMEKEQSGLLLKKLRMPLASRVLSLMRSPLELALLVLCWPTLLLDALPAYLSDAFGGAKEYYEVQLRLAFALLLCTHAVAEGPRWQLGLVYLAGLCTCTGLASTTTVGFYVGVVFSVAAAATSLLLSYLFPPSLPCLTRGSYQVGSTTQHLRAPHISTPTMAIEQDVEFMLKVYYPVEKRLRFHWQSPVNLRTLIVLLFSAGVYVAVYPSLGVVGIAYMCLLCGCTAFNFLRESLTPRSPYLTHGLESACAIARYAGMPTLLTSHLVLYTLPAYEEVACLACAPGSLPVLFFLHGLGGSMSSYSSLVLDYASQGYVVVVPEFNDGSACITVFPDGRRTHHVYLDNATVKPGSELEWQLRNAQLLRRAQETNLAHELLRTLGGPPQMEETKTVSPGESFLVLSPGLESLRGRLDLNNVSLIGHSFGGATCLQVLLGDDVAAAKQDRFRSVVLMDAWYMPLQAERLKTELNVPLLAMHSSLWQWDKNARSEQQLVTVAAKSHVNQLRLLDMNHVNFSDFAILAPELLKKLRGGGPNDPLEAISSISIMTLLFLEASRQYGGRVKQHVEEEWERWLHDEQARSQDYPPMELLYSRRRLS